MPKIEMRATCVTSKGIFKRGQIYEIPEAGLKEFTPEYIRILETEIKTAPETRAKKPATKKKTATKK